MGGLGAQLIALAAIPQPTIAAVAGRAYSAGLEVALACDIRIADDGATFAMPDTAAGSVPRAGGTQRLPRAVGRAHALRLLLTGETIDAAEARRIGLVSRVVPSGGTALLDAALARAIAAKGPIATRCTKEAVARGDFIARMEINLEFNRLLARATHNPVLAVLTDALVGITRDFVHAVGVMPNRFALLSRERLLEHLRQRDGEAAAREVGDYLQRAQRYQFGQVGGVRGSGKPRAPAPAKPEPVAPVAKAPRAAPATRGRNTAPQAVPAKKTQRS